MATHVVGSPISGAAMSRSKRHRTESTESEGVEEEALSVGNVSDIMSAIKALEQEIRAISRLTIAEKNKLQDCIGPIRDAGLLMSLELTGLKGRLEERKEIVKVLSEKMNSVTNTKVSYAQALKTPAVTTSGIKSIKPKSQWQPSRVVTVKPVAGKESSFKNSEDVGLKLREIIKPAESNIAVKKVSNLRAKGVMIETACDEGLKFFMSNNQALSEAGLVVSIPEKKLPRIIIYDVGSDVPIEEVKASILRHNKDVNIDELKAGFKTGPKDKKFVNWVIEVSPTARNTIIRNRRVYIGWSSCRVQDFIRVSRCYKCHTYGHIARFCKEEKQICGHCSVSGHDQKACTKLAEVPTCLPCQRANRASDHSSRSKVCTAYKMALDLLLKKTVYAS